VKVAGSCLDGRDRPAGNLIRKFERIGYNMLSPGYDTVIKVFLSTKMIVLINDGCSWFL